MRLNVERASDLLDAVLQDAATGNLITLSVMIPPSQKELVEYLAKVNRLPQAAIVRAIFDEWSTYKKQELEAQ